MPRYVCHKVVHALKILAIEILGRGDGSAMITPADVGYGKFETPPLFVEKYKGTDEDKGYYVVYADGYASWSPTKAFEEGYSKE